MELSLLIEALQQAKQITALEEDILNTWKEWQKEPLDRNSARLQIVRNNAKHPDIFAAIKTLPTTEVRPFTGATEEDIRYNLYNQLIALFAKEKLQR